MSEKTCPDGCGAAADAHCWNTSFWDEPSAPILPGSLVVIDAGSTLAVGYVDSIDETAAGHAANVTAVRLRPGTWKAGGNPSIDAASWRVPLDKVTPLYSKRGVRPRLDSATAEGAIALFASLKPKWSDLVRATCDPEIAEGAIALLDIGCFEDDLAAAFDALDRDDRARIKAGAEAARDTVRAAGGTAEGAQAAWTQALRDGVAMAIRGVAS